MPLQCKTRDEEIRGSGSRRDFEARGTCRQREKASQKGINASTNGTFRENHRADGVFITEDLLILQSTVSRRPSWILFPWGSRNETCAAGECTSSSFPRSAVLWLPAAPLSKSSLPSVNILGSFNCSPGVVLHAFLILSVHLWQTSV